MDAQLEVKPSTIHGVGVFALRRLPSRRKIGELTGTLISIREARRRAEGQRCIQIVEFDDGMALDAAQGNVFKHINHSCRPNTYMRRIGHRVEFYTLRAIKQGEELTCNYGETQHEGTLPCRCGAKGCRGNL